MWEQPCLLCDVVATGITIQSSSVQFSRGAAFIYHIVWWYQLR